MATTQDLDVKNKLLV